MILDFQKSELQIVASLSGRTEFKVVLEWLDRSLADTHTRLYGASTDREQHFLIAEAATMDSIIKKCRQARDRAEGAATPKLPNDTY